MMRPDGDGGGRVPTIPDVSGTPSVRGRQTADDPFPRDLSSNELRQPGDRAHDRAHHVLARLLAAEREEFAPEGLHLAHRDAGAHELASQRHDAARPCRPSCP